MNEHADDVDTSPIVPAGIAIAVLIGAALRLVDLENRPIHHDEAVNWYFVSGVLRNGWYDYDPSNYHGPLLFQIGALFRWLFGGSLLVERLPGALMGAAMPAMVWPLRRWLGPIGTVTAACCLALSPCLIFFSRDAIHEIWLAAGSVAAVAALASAADRMSTRNAVLAGLSVGLMICMKETVIIVVCAWIVGLVSSRLFSGDNPPPLPYKPMTAAALGLVVLSYTNAFQRPGDLLELLETLNLWGPRGVDGDGHNKPMPYFLELIGLWEGPTLALASIGTLWALFTRHRAGVFLSGWAWSTIFVYTMISYKTPWLILQLVTPLTLLAGLGAQVLPRKAGWFVLPLVCGGLGYRAVELSFERYDDPSTKLAYVQNRREHHAFMLYVQELAKEDEEKLEVRSVFSARYPINWYMRGIGVTHADDPWPPSLDADVLLSGDRDGAKVHEHLDQSYWKKKIKFRGHMNMLAWVNAEHGEPPGEGWKLIEPTPINFDMLAKPETTEPGLKVSWYKGAFPTGEPETSEVVDTIGYRWKKEAAKTVKAPFYVRHEGWFNITDPGDYHILLASDDGSRMWIDGSLAVDNWGDHATEKKEADVPLTEGWHHLRLDAYDVGGVAELKVLWHLPEGMPEPLPVANMVH